MHAEKTGEKATWEPEDLELLFTELEKTVPFDKSRVYLIGYSMGGYGTWAWAAAFPQHFAAIAPHAGGLGRGGPMDVTHELDAWVKRLAPLPVWIFHGAKDAVVPPERSERMLKALKSKGASQVELTLFAEKGHGIGSNFRNPDLYSWLLQHSR